MSIEKNKELLKDLKKHFPDLHSAIDREYAGKIIPDTIIEIIKLLPKKKIN